jgi:hypothetical protein
LRLAPRNATPRLAAHINKEHQWPGFPFKQEREGDEGEREEEDLRGSKFETPNSIIGIIESPEWRLVLPPPCLDPPVKVAVF